MNTPVESKSRDSKPPVKSNDKVEIVINPRALGQALAPISNPVQQLPKVISNNVGWALKIYIHS